MSLRTSPPEGIRAALKRHGVDFGEVALSVSTDINASGEHDRQWLLVTHSRLLVFDPEFGSEPAYVFSLNEIDEFRNAAAIGSGILQIRVEGVWLDLLRFSNQHKYLFDRVVKRLWQAKRGEPLLPADADEHDPQRCPNCGLILEFQGELCPRCLKHRVALRRVLGMLKPYWRASLVLTVFLLIGIGLDMAWPLLTRYLVDHVLTTPATAKPQEVGPLGKVDPRSLLVLVVLGLAGVQILRGVTNVITGFIGSRVGNALTFDIRSQLVRKLEELGLAYYSKQETGSLVGRIAYDTDAIQGFIGQITSGFLMQFLLVIISFAMMMSLEPSLAFWAMLPAPFVLGGAFVYWRYVHPHFQRYWDRSSKQAGLLNGLLSGIRVVKAFAQEESEYNRFQKSSMDVRHSREMLDRTAAYFYPLMGLVFQVGGWIIWYVGGTEVLGARISLGTLMAFFGYLSMFYGPLGNLTNLTTWLTQFSTQMHRIYEILDTPSVLPVSEHPVPLGATRSGEIEFKDVTFGYSRGAPVLRNLTLKIRPGEKIGIVGRSGSGKTSLVNLVCRFYDVDSGQILLDGVDLRNISKDDLRSRISIVLQEPFLFRGTLRENIVYGRPDAEVDAILTASRSAAAHDFIMRHQLAYDTPVGERGQELSGGERQRISIARALLCDPAVLILDEATASIDTESELAIQTALEEVGRNRTMLIIAHRLSTLQNCDRIYVIDNGQIAESGSHRELIELDGRYAGWVRIQQGKSYVEMTAGGKIINERRVQWQEGSPTLPPMQGYRPRWLRPHRDFFERGPRRELQINVQGEGFYRGAFALRCFPVHHPESFISLRHVNAEGNVEEIGIIRSLADWSVPAQDLVRESLSRRYFFQRIEKINSIRKFAQFLEFQAQTDFGPAEFIIRHVPDSAQEYGQKGKLLIDLEDNMYLIPDLEKLGRFEKEAYDRYIYW